MKKNLKKIFLKGVFQPKICVFSSIFRQKKNPKIHVNSKFLSESENDDHSDCSSVYSHPSMLDSGEMSYQHAVLGGLKGSSSSSMRRVASNQKIQLPQSPLFSSTPVDSTILDQVKIGKANSRLDFVQTVSDVAPDAPPGYQPLVISRRIRRPSKQKSNSRSSSESASRDSRRVTEAISTRDSRANSDLVRKIPGKNLENCGKIARKLDEKSKSWLNI